MDTSVLRLLIVSPILALAAFVAFEALPSTYYVLAQPVATLVAVGVAVWAIVTQRTIAREKNTLDFILRFETDKQFYDLRSDVDLLLQQGTFTNAFVDWISNSRKPIGRTLKVNNEEHVQLYRAIDFLNFLEAMATAARKGIVSAAIIEELYGDIARDYWERTYSCVEAIWKKDGRCYENLERLIKREIR